MFTARRKEAYLRLHPETAHGAVGRGGYEKSGQPCHSFADDQAAKTGTAARTVRRDAERGEKIAPAALAMVKGTSLDTGVFLDRLKRHVTRKRKRATHAEVALHRNSSRRRSAMQG